MNNIGKILRNSLLTAGIFFISLAVSPVRADAAISDNLSDNTLQIYNAVSELSDQIVSGKATTSKLEVTLDRRENASRVGKEQTYAYTAAAYEHPEKFFWAANGNCSYTYDQQTGKLSISYEISSPYRSGSKGYKLKAKNAASTYKSTVKKAQKIAAKVTGSTDYDKMKSILEQVDKLTSYNTAAAEEIGSKITNYEPWNINYVFDGKKSTKVVCEGYAKAFKYLCDLTNFSSDKVSARIVSGNMTYYNSGKQPHMWDVVTMDDGSNYIVDPTNSDSGMIGSGGELFIRSCDSGNINAGYSVFVDKISYTYYYSASETRSIYKDSELTISNLSYQVPENSSSRK